MTQQTSSRAARPSARGFATAGVVAVLCVLGTSVAWKEAGTMHATGSLPVASPRVTPLSAAPVASYAAIVEHVTPAVVTIYIERHADAVQTALPFPEGLLRQFFGEEPAPQPRARQQGLGSGVVVSPDGYILTNHHVVDHAEQIHVELSDRRVLTGTVVGDDALSDLAVLKVHATGLPTLKLADSDRTRVGDIVLAVGNPLGVGQTVTAGIISAKGRTTRAGEDGFEDFLQTDAPINQGNSGGALVNLEGELIGINSQILSPSGGNIGLGIAIPSNMVRNVMGQLINQGHVRRAKLGVNVQPVTADLAASLGLAEVRGALVGGVEPQSPAARAGLRQGDVIVEVQGRRVSDANDLRNAIASSKPGTMITLKVLRSGRPEVLSARLEELHVKAASSATTGGISGDGRFGMAVQPIIPEVAEALSLSRSTKGLVVTGVDPDGLAAESGVQPNDVIERVNGEPTTSVSELRAAIERTPDRPALMLIDRDGSSMFLALRPSRS